MGSMWLTPPSHNDAGRKVQRQQPRATRAALQLPAVFFQRPALVQQTKASQASKEQHVLARPLSVLRVQDAAALVEETAGFNVEATDKDEAQVRQQLAEMKLDEVRRS